MGTTNTKKRGKPLPFDTYARFAVGVGYQAALKWRHATVEPGHLLFGLAQAAPEILPDDVSDEVLRHMRSRIESAGVSPERGERPLRYSDAAKAVFDQSRLDAFRAGGQAVGPAHLLAALKGTRDAACRPFLGDGDEQPAAVEAARSGLGKGAEQLDWIVLADDASVPYSHQLAERIKDAIATGKMLPGQRLPTIRQLAETLNLAPGTVGKTYRALDEEGVIETAGSKGTTVSVPSQHAGEGQRATRLDTLSELLRPVAVAAFHMGGDLAELEAALQRASDGVFPDAAGEASGKG